MKENDLRFGSWRVERTLGRDLCGTYYVARREPTDERATLYVLSGHVRLPEVGRDELLRGLVVRHGRVDHAGLIRFREVDRDEDDAFLVADALDDVLAPLRSGRRPIAADVRETGALMADALADAHAAALFHGALDLDNVVWAPGRSPRILGAGVAALGSTDHAAMASGDVAALGRILCALVAGWQPRAASAAHHLLSPGTTIDSSTRELVRLLADPGAALSMREAHALLRSSEPTRISVAVSETGSGETRPNGGRVARAAAGTGGGDLGVLAEPLPAASSDLASDATNAAPGDTSPDHPGGRLGRYKILNQLGRGGMGEVFLAEDPVLRRGVAIKRIRPGLERDRTYRARLRREAQMAAKLGHRAIVQVFDLVTEAGADHVIMEYVPGPSLHAMLASGPVPSHEVVRIGRELADGLAHAHQHGIIHRDLKLENILFTHDGQPKIADFGIARRSATATGGGEPGESLTREGFVVGTSRAMSPEQIQGHAVDARSDLFSLGVLLYELLTTQSPFAADVDAQTILRVLHHRQPSAREVMPSVPGGLSDLVDRLLEKNPLHRPQNAREVLAALARVDDPEAPASEPARTGPLEGATWSLRAPAIPALAVATGSDPALPATRAERRQVTVACFDLMMDPEPEEPDPEPLADVLPRFRTQVDEVLGHFEGSLVSVMGHRLVVCFGYPRPLEDAARRAVLAARALVDAAAQVRTADPAHTAVRFGARAAVHTGLAIVRRTRGASTGGATTSGVDELVLGTTLDAGLRLLQLGVPGELWLSNATARLVESDFTLEAPPSLPDGVTSARRVVGAVAAPTPGSGEHDRPLVARDMELALLASGWRRARQGAGQAALLVGDPGIGKSRLVRELQRAVGTDQQRQFLVRGTAHQQRSALEPAAELVSALLGIGSAGDEARANLLDAPAATPTQASDAETATRSRERLSPEAAAALVVQLTAGRDEALAVLRLLELPVSLLGDAPAAEPVTPDRARAQLLGGLRDIVLRSADDGPLLVVIEDLHWLDASTLDLVALLVADLSASPIYLLMTTRPGVQPPWPQSAPVTQLQLSRLDAVAIDALIAHASARAGRTLAPREAALIAARSEGVPLYAEELVRAALDVDRGTTDAVPSTLRDALAARLHQLGPLTTRVAHVAAVAGRELTAELVAGAGEIERATVDRELDRLVAAEILFRRRGRQRETLFVFRHVLLQQAAYEELVAADRRAIHGRIADAHLAAPTPPPPELVAHHLAGARRFAEAIGSAGQAAATALARHAMVEAIELFRQSIAWLDQTPASADRDRMEIGLRMQLGALLIATAGYTSPELEASCARAEALCEVHPDVAMPVKYGLWAVRLMRGGVDLDPLIGWFERVITTSDDPAELMMAHASLGTHGYVSASYARSRHHLGEAMKRFDPASHRRVVQTYGGAGGFYGHVLTSSVLWHVGESEAAWRHNQETLALARTLDDPYTLAVAVAYDLVQGFATHDPDRAERAADEVRGLSERFGFPYFLCTAMVGHGWAQVMRGHHERGLREIEAGLGGKQMMGVKVYHAYYIAHLIEAALAAGQIELGLRAVDEALALCRTTVDRMYEAEIVRLRGELWLRQGQGSRQAREAACSSFEEARALADAVSAHTFVLRAATSLARVLRDLDRAGEAALALDAAIVRFPDSKLEAASDPDLKLARGLRQELP
jgi:class 3 adenylate cyclase